MNMCDGWNMTNWSENGFTSNNEVIPKSNSEHLHVEISDYVYGDMSLRNEY